MYYNKTLMDNSKIMLLSKGEEDKYLTGESTNTFFKDSYKQHSNFSQRWSTIPVIKCDPVRIPTQEGDLLYNLWLTCNGFNPAQGGAGAGGALDFIDTITIKCDDKVLQTLDYNFLNIHNKIITNSNQFQIQNSQLSSVAQDPLFLKIPFWFSKNPGSALPLWLLDKSNLTLTIKIKSRYSSWNLDFQFIAQWINLTPKEKDVFKNSSLEYLIEQVDILNKVNLDNKTRVKIDIPRSKFVKYLAWNIRQTAAVAWPEELMSIDWIEKNTLLLDGVPIIDDKPAYFTRITNRYNNFKGPNYEESWDGMGEHKNDLHIHVASFSIDPAKFQSSGFLTTEKYKNFTLEISRCNIKNSPLTNVIGKNLLPYHLHVYVVRHNIMRIKDGVLNLLHN